MPLGEVQFEERGRARYPMSGCPDDEGCFNVLSTKRDERGLYRPYTGSSFVMAAELARGGPRGRAILRYSQSENPRSPYYRDQTALYAKEQWLPLRYTDAQIRSDPGYKHRTVSGPR